TMASPPTAANAASLAVSMRLGLPLAVMYRKPAQARKSAAAARPIFVASSSSVLKSWVMELIPAMLSPFEVVKQELGSASATSRAAAADEVIAPEPGEHRLNRDHLAFCGRIDLLAIADVNADMCDPIVRIGIRAREENQIARLELVAWDSQGRIELLL